MKRILFCAAFMCLAAALHAQTSFVGNWTITGKEHTEGPEYGNAIADRYVVTQNADSLIVESYSGETKGRQAFAMNGAKITTNSAASQRRYVRSLAWSADKKTVTFTTTFSMPGEAEKLDFTRTEVWSLSADGSALTVVKRSEETRSETWAVNGTYSKQ